MVQHRSLVLLVVMLARACAAGADTARVCELTLPKFVDGQYDLHVLLYHREGRFYHGYARVSQRDNLPHRVDATPARPFEFVFKNGDRPNITPKLKGTYAYHDPVWRRLRDQYAKGELLHRYTAQADPLVWDERRGTLAGTIDVWLMPVDEANHWGLSPPRNFQNWRVTLSTTQADGRLRGKYKAWRYDGKDETFGRDAPRESGELHGRWVPDHWRAKKGTEYAKGTDWPQVRGPHLTMAADDCDRPLVDNLHDARLLWVAEEPITDGKGGAPKVAFGFYPANFSGWGYGAYGAPIIVGGRVYLHLVYPDRAKLLADARARDDILVKRGADVELVAGGYDARRHAVFCFDARTGKTLWRWFDGATFGHSASGKSGKGLTPCCHKGRIYARGRGITCLDAATGQLLWTRTGRDRKDRAYRTGGGWSRDESPVVIGGTLVFNAHPGTTLVGLDPGTGDELWRHPRVTGYNSVPTKVTLDGREYVISASGVQIGDKDVGAENRMVLIEPRSGEIVWESHLTGKNTVALLVDGNRVCGNGSRSDMRGKDSEVDKHMRAGCFEVSTRGAEKLWHSDQIGYPPHRATPVAHKGYFYIDSRQTGFACVDARTGRIVNQHPHIHAMTRGDHNWTWHVASNDRIVTSGCLLFSTADQGFKRLPGRLSLDLTSGYMCPVKPAIADGRLFLRTLNKLVCYDLRKPENREISSIAITLGQFLLGYPKGTNRSELQVRIVDGTLTECYARLPRRNEVGRPSLGPAQGARINGLSLGHESLTGTMNVRFPHHHERWQLDLRRDGDKFVGRCERHVPALAKPLRVQDRINGKLEKKPDGSTWRIFSLSQAVSQKPTDPDHPRVVLHLVVETARDGTVHHWGRAGRMNRATHEVDASGLVIGKESARGRATVILHADPWVAPNPETGGPLAAVFEIDASIAGDEIVGTYKGTLGVEFRKRAAATAIHRSGKDIK